MKEWQKSRNYRRLKDQNGVVISRIVTIDGIDIEVTEEVFCVYAQAERRERYITDEQEMGKILSLDQLQADGLFMSVLEEHLPSSAEAEAIQAEELYLLRIALRQLNPDEAALIRSIFFEGLSERQLSKRTGVPYMTIHNRKVRILKKLKYFLER